MASSPTTSWQIERKKIEAVTDFLFLHSKITADSDCSHEVRRHLLLGRKAITNLDSVLKSKDITLLTKDCIVKAMAFPVVMYRCESWTIKTSWVPKNWCFWVVVLEKTFKSPWDCKEIKPVNPKGDQPWIFIGRMMLKLKLQYFDHLMQRANSLEKTLMLGKIESQRIRGWQMMRQLVSITASMDMNLRKHQEIVEDREA